MSTASDLIYYYDSTLNGFFTCVFESFEKKEQPWQITAHLPEQISFCRMKEIITDREKAQRVAKSLVSRLSADIDEFIRLAFLTNLQDKELLLLDFIRKAFRYGKEILYQITDDTVSKLTKAIQFLHNESHLFCGFVRFSFYHEVAVSVIHPKNMILPLVRKHFCERFSNQPFLIYDQTHRMALVHHNGHSRIIPMENLQLDNPSEEELRYRKLWQEFYQTIAIKERENPKCRMSHMPKRYWQDMTEFQAECESPLSHFDPAFPQISA